MGEKSKANLPTAYRPNDVSRASAETGPYSGFNGMVEHPALRHRFDSPDAKEYTYGGRTAGNGRGGGGGVAEQRRAAQNRKNRQHAGLIFVVVMLGTIGYNYKDMPNCIQTARGFCAYAFPPSIATQEMCAVQACRAYEYTIQKNFDWSKYTKEMHGVVGRPSAAQSIPPADASAWSLDGLTTMLSGFFGSTSSTGDGKGAPPAAAGGAAAAAAADFLGGGGASLDMAIDPANDFDPAEFARQWQMQQMMGGGDHGGGGAASVEEAVFAAETTARMHAESEWTQKGRGPRTGMAPMEKAAWTGYVEDGEHTLDYTCTIGCNLLKDAAAQRRCLANCKNQFQ